MQSAHGRRPHEPAGQRRDKAVRCYQAICAFRRHKINMTKLNRAQQTEGVEYFFSLIATATCRTANSSKHPASGEHCNFVKVLGSYPNTE